MLELSHPHSGYSDYFPFFEDLQSKDAIKVTVTVADAGMAPSVLVVWETTPMSIPYAA